MHVVRAEDSYSTLQCSLAHCGFQKQACERVGKTEECTDVLHVDPLRVNGLDRRTFSVNETTNDGRVN